jgi:hypothetical protein
MKIIGIDVGLVNLAFCVYDTTLNTVNVDKISLLYSAVENKRYKYSESTLVFLIKNFIVEHEIVFKDADIVVIEHQMKRNMLIIQYSIASFLLACSIKVRFIHPRQVRLFYHISKNNYVKNKQASIDLLPKILSKTQLKSANIERFQKKDDVCEAVILALYCSKNLHLLDKVESIESHRTTTTKTTTTRKRKRCKRSTNSKKQKKK